MNLVKKIEGPRDKGRGTRGKGPGAREEIRKRSVE